VVIKTAYSGVSVGTEMWNAYGNLKFYGEPPFINGYQATGTVVEVGENLKWKYREGDYVAVFCSGAHAEFVKSKGDLIHKLSSEKSLQPCSMFVQPSVAMNAWNITGVEAGNTVYVIGQGLIGQCAALLARLKGAYVITSELGGICGDL
jgi:threonine dehydrogenase-like Zn-dependent dehydrogenase